MKLTEAQIAHIVTLESEGRRLTPSALVADARDRKSPLHPLFEWNTKKAAEAHWLHTAREIIGEVRVIVQTQEYTIKAPAYVRDSDAKGGQGYRHVEALRRNPDQARESLVYTLETAAGHLRRAYDLSVSLGLQGEIDALLEQVAGVQRQVRAAA